LDRCEACRENVRQLTVTGEELVGLLPAIEPPAGFETRVMERLGLGAPAPVPAPARRVSLARRFSRKQAGWIGGGWTGRGGVSYRRRILSTAAVAAAVIVAGRVGWGLHAATSSPAASPLSSAAFLTATHQTAGKVYFYDGDHRWLYMSVDIGSGNNTVICQVEGSDGRFTTIGSFRLSGGYGYWGSPD